jgi:hypothetical protein
LELAGLQSVYLVDAVARTEPAAPQRAPIPRLIDPVSGFKEKSTDLHCKVQ